MSDSEQRFMKVAGERVPGIAGYGGTASRPETDRQLRDYLASELDLLRGKVDEIRGVADEEGDADMVEDVGRLDERLARTAEALRAADYTGAAFFAGEDPGQAVLDRVYAFDLAMIEDLDLLARDLGELKYDSIGALTLREIEGTLASIELRVANRKHLMANPAS